MDEKKRQMMKDLKNMQRYSISSEDLKVSQNNDNMSHNTYTNKTTGNVKMKQLRNNLRGSQSYKITNEVPCVKKVEVKQEKSVLKNTKKDKSKKIKLMKTRPILFILSRKEKIREYKENVEAFGFPLDQIPRRYRTEEICKLSAKKSPERFDFNDVPTKYLNYDFCKTCVEHGVYVSEVPDKFIDLNLIEFALEHGARLFTISDKYVTKDLCEFAIKQNAYNVLDIKNKDFKTQEMYQLAFDRGFHWFENENHEHGIPDNFVTREMCETIIKEHPCMIADAPKNLLDNDMYRLALECGLTINQVPKNFVGESATEDICIRDVKKDYININYVPEKFLNSHIYAIACEGGFSIQLIDDKYINDEVCIAHIKKTGEIAGIKEEFRTARVYEELVKCNADNLLDVPFRENECKRTKEMCAEYVRQKHTINFNLFPQRFLSYGLKKALFEDAIKYRDILDGYMDYQEYVRVKSLSSEEQVDYYERLLEKYLQNKLSDPNTTVPSASDEEMKILDQSISYNMVKDCNFNNIFCEDEVDSPKNIRELEKVISSLKLIIEKEDPKFNYAKSYSSEEELRLVASDYYNRFNNIVKNNSSNPEVKRYLTESLWLELKNIIKDLKDSKKEIIISEMQSLNEKYTNDSEDKTIFKTIFGRIENFKDADTNSKKNSKEKLLDEKVSDEISFMLDGIEYVCKNSNSMK